MAAERKRAEPANLDQQYGYDDVNQLTSFISNSSNQSYQYDANGNRMLLTIGGNSYGNMIDSASIRLLMR